MNLLIQLLKKIEKKSIDQILALEDLKKMALKYGFDISVPASNAKEAFQWLYFWISRCYKRPKWCCYEFGKNYYFLRYICRKRFK